MKSIRKPLITGVIISSLLLTSLTGCGAASGDAKDTSQEVSGDSSTSSENTFAFSEDCDMELTSTTIVGRVTGISDNIVSLDIADLSDVTFQGPGQLPEGDGKAPTDEQAPDGDAASGKPEGDSSSSEQGEPPEKPTDSQGEPPEMPDDQGEPMEMPDDQDNSSGKPDRKDGNFKGGKDFSFDLDSLTYVPGTLTIEDESMLLSATERSLMSLFKGGDRMKGSFGDADSMPDLGSASDSSDSSDSDSSTLDSSDSDSSDSSAEGSGSSDGKQGPDEKQFSTEETEEPVSLSELSEGSIVLITFDESGIITAIHVITDTEFLEQLENGGQPADLQAPASQDQDSQDSKSTEE